MATTSTCARYNRNSTTRMDVISSMLKSDMPGLPVQSLPASNGLGARDSLSPLGEHSSSNDTRNVGGVERHHHDRRGTRQTQQEAHVSFPASLTDHATASPQPSTTEQAGQACSPRSSTRTSRPRRPTDLTLDRSNGLTTSTPQQLKQAICDSHTDIAACTTKVQLARLKPKKRIPKTPAPVHVARDAAAMGNQHSSLGENGDVADNASVNSVVRRPMRVLRKSSTNLFKRIDSKSPLPRPLTATSIVVTEQHRSPTSECGLNQFNDPPHSAKDSIIMLPSASTMTVTDESAGQPLSPSTTVQEASRDSQAPLDGTEGEDDNDFDQPVPPKPAHRPAALSPTIPAPSPLPEDSPHKYGLKDRMDTPEPAVKPPDDIKFAKNRRRSSALDIFNEVKSLQSAASFLNGLSTSRRRAESANRTTDASWTTMTDVTSRPPSTRPMSRPGSARPPSAAHLRSQNNNITTCDLSKLDGRRRGHLFKSNGFAYSRPLSLNQLRCYRNHARLLASKNKQAPVECAVCHMDDDQEHWSCSWCAMRMCRYCRKDFSERGVAALRERIRQAEMGGVSASSSEASLRTCQGRGRSRGLGA